jgi:hypothetical protein
MELSLCLSFYLRGYTMGTTMGFPVKIGEALAHNLATKSCGSARNNI